MKDTIDLLAELPTLAAEVLETKDAPNPTERPLAHTPRAFPAPVANLEALDALNLLFDLCQCVRAVYEDMSEHPGDLADPPTWASESAWLIAHAADWQADLYLSELIPDEVRRIHNDLSAANNEPKPLRLYCPITGCGMPLHERDGGTWWSCEGGHTIDHGPYVERYARELAAARTVTLREAATELGVPWRTLRWRVNRAGLERDAGTAHRPQYRLDTLAALCGVDAA